MNSGEAERLWKLYTSASSLVLAGRRDADPLIQFLQQFVFGNSLPDIPWPEAYKALGMEDEWSAAKDLVLPERQDLWVMPVVNGVTSNKVVRGHKRLGVNFYLCADDLDAAVPTHDRDPNRDGPYVIGFRRIAEADEENKGLSANQLRDKNHKGITLPERLLLGAGFYVATGQHLDTKTETLCSGSRFSGGYVPRVYWFPADRRVYVHWYSPGGAYVLLRARSAVSLAGEALSSQP